MLFARPFALTLCGALMLTACAGSSGASAQSMPLQADAGHAPMAPAAATPDAALSPDSMGESAEIDNGGEDGDNTGTSVGQKVAALRGELTQLDGAVRTEAGELQRLRANTQASAVDYFNSVAVINAKLQVGTTTGNPILVAQWNTAQAKLEALSQNVAALNDLSTKIAASASQSAYLLESVRATFGLSGAVDEDHVHLSALEDDVNRTVVLIDRLLNEITGDINRQSTYVSAERRNLQTLSLAINNGEMYGQSLANHPYMSALPGAPDSGAAHETGRPLVVIRFDRDSVNYQHAVYQAVSQALDRYPQASFDVVAVSPNGGNPAEGALAAEAAKRNADGVARTLSEMGLPSGRIQMSATSSSNAHTTEVRIYVH